MFNPEMLEKLQQLRGEVEVSKERLNSLTVTGEAGGNLIVVEMTGNRVLKQLTIHADLKQMEKEDLEDLLTVALNRALEAANELNENEVADSARKFIPGM